VTDTDGATFIKDNSFFFTG
jgi:hypothetical protein